MTCKWTLGALPSVAYCRVGNSEKVNAMNIPLTALGLRFGSSVVAVYGAMSLSGCMYPDSSERLDDNIVFTGHAKETEFSNFKTFAVDPTVHVASVQADNSVSTDTADSNVSQQITDHVANLLTGRGYTQVSQREDPDLAVTVTGISGVQVGSISGGYWGGYYSTYWGFPGYSYYYPYNTYYTYNTGSLIVDMADLSDARASLPTAPAEPDQPAPGGLAVVWTMIGYKAYLDDSGTTRVSSAKDAIDQAFEQSPYLTRK
jgi:hypothetical protein